MSNDAERAVEKAAGRRGDGTFPTSWGNPPGSPYSEERAAWIRSECRVEARPTLPRPPGSEGRTLPVDASGGRLGVQEEQIGFPLSDPLCKGATVSQRWPQRLLPVSKGFDCGIARHLFGCMYRFRVGGTGFAGARPVLPLRLRTTTTGSGSV